MSRPWRIRYSGAKYHVTVRGNNRQCVFHADGDYLRFLDRLADSLEKDSVILYAYVLMPNHFHLFVETPYGNLPRFMQRLNTAYSMYHKRLALELACRHTGESQRRIGEYFGYRGNGAVTKQRQRLREQLAHDIAFKRQLDKLEKRIAKS